MQMKRRKFLQTASATATAFAILKARLVFGYQANSAVRMALLGCGNRGTHVATSFSQNTAAQVVALADLFIDQLGAAKAHFDKLNTTLDRAPVDPKLTFRGPKAFEMLAESSDVDMIQVSTPPFFHVEHLEAVVLAGKHAYCEKPVGIDVRQAKHALEIAKRVHPNQSVDVGFQCRNAPPIAAIAEKIKAGALGKVATVSGYYYAPASKEKAGQLLEKGAAAHDEYRLRNWLWDRALSGDILVEQNIHIVDLCNWILGAHPLKAMATGGRSVLMHAGDCWDNYQVEFTYPNGERLSFASKQFGEYTMFEAGLRLFGSEGAANVPYAGPVEIVGSQPWSWTESMNSATASGKFAANGAFGDNLAFADRDKERRFIDSIVGGTAHNQIAAGVETAMSCMLGRMAGLKGHEVSWEQLEAHGETYQLGMDLGQFG
jgi:myo-inositol 2-dehydrogenase / D-chiro-inositol 1-dehydrogenase